MSSSGGARGPHAAGGYPSDLFVGQPVQADFLCSICKDVMRHPVEAFNE